MKLSVSGARQNKNTKPANNFYWFFGVLVEVEVIQYFFLNFIDRL